MMKRLLTAVCMAALFGSCNSPVKREATGFTQGTTYRVVYYDANTDLQYQIDSLLLAFDRVLSTYQDNSYISKWNKNDLGNAAQPEFFRKVVSKALEINKLSDDAFDITVTPLMKYWFDNDWENAQIDSSVVDSIMQNVGMGLISLNGKDYVKTNPNVRLDVNALAQGFSVDVVADFLESRSVHSYLVEIGGEVKGAGKKPGEEEWVVGIDRPSGRNQEHELAMSVRLNDRALATSGNYRKYVLINGRKYGHSLNPVTGFPATTDVLSASVLASDCMTADALATVCMVIGFDRSKQLIEQHPEYQAVLIHTDSSGTGTWYSASLQTDLDQ